MSHMSKCYPYKWQHFKAVHMEQYSDIPNMPPYHHGVQHVVCIEECTKLSIYAMHKHLTNGLTTTNAVRQYPGGAGSKCPQ